MSSINLAYLGLDECGSLPDDTAWFVLAGVLTRRPDAVQRLVRRAAIGSGKRLRRVRRAISEFKWSNSSQRLREDVLSRMARAEVEIFTLAVRKGGRRIEDTPENYAALACELLEACWVAYSNLAIFLDRHFNSAAQVAVFNTLVYRRWPVAGALSIQHLDSQREALIQLADFAAGVTYAWHKAGDSSQDLILRKVRQAIVKDWPEIKRRWL